MTYSTEITFIEAPAFSRLIHDYLDDAEYAAMQWSLALHPETGVVIPGSGGVRKLRWCVAGRGKRGGVRVIYYWRTRQGEIWLLTIYAKNETENMTAAVLRQLKEEIDGL
ncbi:MAG: transcriptional regulator [Magnetococcales bacterium]|nr:transcriptional regulator [Magnetococcales bacterium]